MTGINLKEIRDSAIERLGAKYDEISVDGFSFFEGGNTIKEDLVLRPKNSQRYVAASIMYALGPQSNGIKSVTPRITSNHIDKTTAAKIEKDITDAFQN